MQEQGLAPIGGVEPRSHRLCVHNTFLPRKVNTLNPGSESLAWGSLTWGSLTPGPFKGFRLPKRHSKLQKSKIELKVTKTGFRLDASDWENPAFRTAPAALQNLGVSRAGRHSTFEELFWAL